MSASTRRSLMRMIRAFLVFLICACVLAVMISVRLGHTHPRVPLTLTASASFLLLAVCGGGLASRYGRLVTTGLAFCFLGDCLVLHSFQLLVLAFLVAQPLLIAGLLVRGVVVRRCLAAGAVMLPVSTGMGLYFAPHLPGDVSHLVYAYIVVITVMVILAMGSRNGAARWYIVPAGISFYVSDAMLARDLFVTPGHFHGASIYPLYYAACVLLALSVSANAFSALSRKPYAEKMIDKLPTGD
ncbi:MAG: lysoplasmalogenase [Phycisphaerae bacterium]|nr:lysoplasmalogenase [Phycisphaerae bacterium]